MVAGVPLGSKSETARDDLFESELPSGPVGGGDSVFREVETAGGDASAMLPLLGAGCVGIVAGVVAAFADGEQQRIADIERPSRIVAFPGQPFEGRGQI